jgi:acetyl-CoA acetyltransferase
MSARVEIAGVGIHPFGRFDGLTNTHMGVHAVRAALAEAGDPRFDAAFCGTAYGGVASGHKVLGALARTGMPIVDVEAGCASGGAALQLAAGAIRAGQYDCVLVFGVEKMPKGIIRSSFFEPWREEAGLAATPAYFALRAQRLLREAGLTKEHLAEVVVKNRRHGVHNTNAMFRKEVTAEAVLASRVVCEPLHLWMLCSPNEGAAAIVLRRATDTSAGSVTLASARLRSHLPGSVLGEATPLSGIDDSGITPPSTLAARDAYDEAGLGPADVDVVECQDTDAARELLAYQELGLCEPGEQAIRAAACCRRASRSGRRRSGRSSSWSTNFAASRGVGRSRARASGSRTLSDAAPTRAALS